MESMDLKVRELLKDHQLDQSTNKIIDKTVAALVEAIQAIPDQKVGENAAPGFVRDLGVVSDKVEFTFKHPESILVGGSHSIKSIAKPDVNVDLLIRMPKECFHEKDYLNHRYHAKRGLYLRVIEQHLKSSRAIWKIQWSTFQDEARKPLLIVFPDVELVELSGFFIRVIPTATSLFSVSRLSLNRNNVRALNEGSITRATPKYNSSILEDMFLEENADFVRKTFQEWRGLEEALILLKVWARNRSSIYSHVCLNGFLTTAIVSYLAACSGGDHINKSMNAMQIFRVTLKFIVSSNLWDKGLALQPPGQCNSSKEEMSQYLQNFSAVLRDASGHVNLAFRMTRKAFLELRDEASWTLDCISNHADGGFEEIFKTKVDFPAKYDFCMRINLKGHNKVSEFGFCMDDECWRICEEKIHSLLQQGLNDRAKIVHVTWRSTPSEWNIEDGFSKFGSDPMLIGIAVSSFSESIRVIDYGPNAENKEEAVKFREFWGEKSELRRFKDGTVSECTVWECEQWERHLIIKRITEYVLSKHFLLSKDNMIHVADQLDFCLLHGAKDPIQYCGDLLQAFELLSKRLGLLEDIPLKISSVQPLDPASRYTSVFPPEPHPLAYEKNVDRIPLKFVPTCIQPLDVMIQLEGSGKWPSDCVAIEKTKSAFLLKIGESLQDRWGMFCTATEDDVNVLMSGYAFRLQILHERSLGLLTNPVESGKIQGISSSDKELFVRNQHSSMINGFHGRYPTYGPVVRLAKRWVASHLFSSFLAEEAIELLVAYLFLKPFPFYAPGSRVAGFLRFLRLLANYDWTFSPLIVDINNDLTLKDRKAINENFILSRKSYEGKSQNVEPAMYLATYYDRCSEAWTKFSPTTSVLKRLVPYARSSGDLLTKLILQGQIGPYTWECLFRTPMNNYDAVILLHRDKLAYPHRLLFPTEMNQGKHIIRGKPSKDFQPYMKLGSASKRLEDRNKLMVDFDPTRCFIEDLKKELSDTFNVWYDSIGGDAIGLTWEKHGSKKREREDESRGDPKDLLKEVGELGKGFVRSVYYLKAPRLKI